jgi:hypothetical protein
MLKEWDDPRSRSPVRTDAPSVAIVRLPLPPLRLYLPRRFIISSQLRGMADAAVGISFSLHITNSCLVKAINASLSRSFDADSSGCRQLVINRYSSRA